MKTPIIILFVALITIRSNAQKDSSLLGYWKLIALSNEGMYYDIKGDSMSLSESVKKEIGSIEKQKMFKESLSIYSGIHIHFESDGHFKETQNDKLLDSGNFQILQKENMLEFTTKDEKGKDETSKIVFEIKNNRLWLYVKEEKLFDFILERN